MKSIRRAMLFASLFAATAAHAGNASEPLEDPQGPYLLGPGFEETDLTSAPLLPVYPPQARHPYFRLKQNLAPPGPVPRELNSGDVLVPVTAGGIAATYEIKIVFCRHAASYSSCAVEVGTAPGKAAPRFCVNPWPAVHPSRTLLMTVTRGWWTQRNNPWNFHLDWAYYQNESELPPADKGSVTLSCGATIGHGVVQDNQWDGAITKCINWGFKPPRYPMTNNVDKNRDEALHGKFEQAIEHMKQRAFVACVRAARADYWGIGKAYTVRNTQIAAYSPPYRDPKCYRMSWCLEGRWNEDGVTCFYHPRNIVSATACGQKIAYRIKAAFEDFKSFSKERPYSETKVWPFYNSTEEWCRRNDGFVLSTRSALNLKYAYWDPLPCQGPPLYTNYDPDCGVSNSETSMSTAAGAGEVPPPPAANPASPP